MLDMFITQQVITYLFPALAAFAILYFFLGIAYVKYVKDYAKIAQGKARAFSALAALFWILVIWAVVHMVVAALY